MKHITFIIGSMGRGGAERVISILANHYAARKTEVDIILLLKNDVQYKIDDSVKIIDFTGRNKERKRNIFFWIANLRKYMIETDSEAIISFVARINILVLIASIGIGKRVIISERNDPANDGRTRIVDVATKLLYPIAESIVFQTESARSYFNQNIKRKGVIIGNPIEIEAVAVEEPKKKIVNVGRLAPQKNQKLLINAFENVLNQFPDYELWIYGEGELRRDLEELISKKKMNGKVFLPGNIDTIHQHIMDAEIFVLSSNYEGLSNALLEAMLMGIPCISTDCAGSNEVIKDGINGILVPVNNENRLSHSLISLIRDKKKQKAITSEAIKTMQEFKSENIIKKWEYVIEK